MSSDYDIKIKSLFDRAKTGQPDDKFVQDVMMNIRRQERNTRLIWLAGLMVMIPFLWLLSPDLEELAISINGFVEFCTDMIVALITDGSQSPLTWIFLVPTLAFYLYSNRQRFT